ncbi:MAG: hypothetical protein KGR98_04410 [Verrucomicrobia bacterium]|nr:hypothetical protein [Verrucomicrobiota bacterium]MDE3100574.1 hypothetical protein [Verrucomicrobiota bacterium]
MDQDNQRRQEAEVDFARTEIAAEGEKHKNRSLENIQDWITGAGFAPAKNVNVCDNPEKGELSAWSLGKIHDWIVGIGFAPVKIAGFPPRNPTEEKGQNLIG